MSLMEHLSELRKRLLRVTVAVLILGAGSGTGYVAPLRQVHAPVTVGFPAMAIALSGVQ